MAKASSNKRRSSSSGKQRQPSLQRRKGRARKTSPKRTTRKKKASLAEVIAVLKDVFSEVRAFRLAVDQHRVVCRQCGAESAANLDKASGGECDHPEPEADCDAKENGGRKAAENGISNPNHVPESSPDAATRPPVSSGELASTPEAKIKAAHQLAFNAGLAKRAHRPLDVLVQFYQHFREGKSPHTRKQLKDVPHSSGHLIGKLFHQMWDMGLLEPAGEPVTVTDKARANNRLDPPVRSWKLTDLGKAVAEYELKLRDQAAAEQRASTAARGAITPVTSVPDNK